MNLGYVFFLNAALFGVALAMDAFSVSLAAGMNEPAIKNGKKSAVAGTFAFFQTAMPLAGWFCVRSIETAFRSFQKFVPWIALALLLYLGIKMIVEGIRSGNDASGNNSLKLSALPVMGIATSIDALSVGFTIADYPFSSALIEAVIIGVETFVICFAGVETGRRLGMKLAGRASILGGVILVGIGIEIFLSGVVFKK
ncbi:MAG: manganese efflux pump [Clostridia bacterium]|nr:manganese efflux pump [Clostridia bacterium]